MAVLFFGVCGIISYMASKEDFKRATDFELPRATVHVTLNHPVQGHSGGSWNDMQFVIFCVWHGLSNSS